MHSDEDGIEDKLFQDFYKDDLYYVNIQILYVNADDELEKLRQTTHLLSAPNKVTWEELAGFIQTHVWNAGKKYHLHAVLRYNVSMEPEEVSLPNESTYLSVVQHMDDIFFQPSISMFHDLNDLILVFHEQCGAKKAHTKKWLSNTCRKTVRKQFKAVP